MIFSIWSVIYVALFALIICKMTEKQISSGALGRINSKFWAITLFTLAVAQIGGVIYLSSTVTYSVAAVWGLIGIAAASYS